MYAKTPYTNPVTTDGTITNPSKPSAKFTALEIANIVNVAKGI